MFRIFTVLLLASLIWGSSLFAQASYDTLSIAELQFVDDPASNDLSTYVGDTVVVQGMVMNYPRDLWVGARWAIYIADPDGYPEPWNGFFIIQHDTSVISTNFGFLEPGMICNFTGVIDEFGNFSQMIIYGPNYFPDPVIPIEILSTGNPLPDPVTLTAADLADVPAAEKWESMLVRVNDASVVNNNISGDWASITDESGGTTYLAEYFLWFRDRLAGNGDGSYSWPANGTNIDVVGFTRDESGTPGRVFNINPRDTSDITIKSNPPTITLLEGLTRDIGAPTSSDAVTVTAVIEDNVSVTSATLHYSVNEATFQQVAMVGDEDDVYTGTIPAANDGDFVRYFLTATDNDGDMAILPGDTSRTSGQVFYYTVRNNATLISDIQNTFGYAIDISGYTGHVVTVEGIVMTDSTDESGDFYIQEAAEKWSGIWVAEDQFPFEKGDKISITGIVEENFTVTRLDDATDISLVEAGVGAFDPVVVTTGEVATGAENAEAYEGVLIKVENVTVTNPFPDAPSNFGEFTIDDGSGGVRVDDWFDAFEGQTNDTAYAEGQVLSSLTAFGYYSFGNVKLIPRDSMDVVIVTSITHEDVMPESFSLEQNYPNPFNPSTVIRYNVTEQTNVKLVIYDALGRTIKTLVNTTQAPGSYNVNFKADRLASGVYFYRLDAGKFSAIKKMLLVR